jgi:hypothetical protein
MPKVAMSVPHTLGQEEAQRRLKERFLTLGETHKSQMQGLQGEWDQNVLKYRFSSFGIPIHGTLTTEPSQVKVEADLPFVAIPLKGTLESQLRQELSKLLA